jgi:phage head maturation protease
MVREFSDVRRPPGRGTVVNRFVETRPTTYDRDARTVDAVLSIGAPVARFYGSEVLRITPSAVVLDRVAAGSCLLLDSHDISGIDNALGVVTRAWFDGGSLVGRIRFNDTEQGRNAEGMVARGEISGVSIGYRVLEWEVKDGDGNLIDPEKDRIRYDDDLTFTAVKWELFEVSLVTVPADPAAAVRSLISQSPRKAGPSAVARARAGIDEIMRERGIWTQDELDWLARIRARR